MQILRFPKTIGFQLGTSFFNTDYSANLYAEIKIDKLTH